MADDLVDHEFGGVRFATERDVWNVGPTTGGTRAHEDRRRYH